MDTFSIEQNGIFFDAHAHLYNLSGEELAVQMKNAADAGVSLIVNTAINLETCAKVQTQAREYPGMLCAAGISPFDVEDLGNAWQERLYSFLASGDFSAIGEIGIDQSNPRYPSLSDQQPIFEKQLDIAAELDIAAVIHSRGCEDLALDLVLERKLRRAVFHCYTGSVETAKRIIDAGYVVSISGIATFKSAPLDAVIMACPLEQILVETDSPYLAPEPFRGKTNEPALVVRTFRKIAELKGIDETALAEIVSITFGEIFGIRR